MSIKSKFILLFLTLVTAVPAFSQENGIYDPEKHKIIPDKVFEIGLPMLFLFLIANTLVSIFKIKAENRLKEKALDKGISEPTLVSLFAEDKKLNNLTYLKWFLILAALGISLLIIHSFAAFLQAKSGYLALGIITLLQAIAFLIYYRILKNR